MHEGKYFLSLPFAADTVAQKWPVFGKNAGYVSASGFQSPAIMVHYNPT